MNTIQEFINKELGQIGTVQENGKIFFVASDVAKIMGYSPTTNMTRNLDDDEKGIHVVNTPGGEQKKLCITESGFYHAIFLANPNNAHKLDEAARAAKAEKLRKFRRWVTDIVLPAIRQSGAYVDGEEHLSKEDAQKLKQEKATLTMKLGQMKSINNRLRKQLAQKESDFWDAQEAMLNDREHLIRRMESEEDIGNLILEGLYAY